MGQIGRSTDPATAENRDDVAGSECASFRYCNPGAQYPSARAARFGQTGYGIIGGGHKIARFPSPVNGAASNFDLLSRSYVGMRIGEAGTKWTGANGFGVPGYDPNAILIKEMVDDSVQAIALLKAERCVRNSIRFADMSGLTVAWVVVSAIGLTYATLATAYSLPLPLPNDVIRSIEAPAV